ncbi:hypothetical protein ACIRG5_45765 [Lentzea sp. NPDC102401]|uniref:hypothetical protein n=1 Tax=Lentzea sp. NPDC102401 TaxID=3364128 RepID=UPI0037F5B67D
MATGATDLAQQAQCTTLDTELVTRAFALLGSAEERPSSAAAASAQMTDKR